MYCTPVQVRYLEVNGRFSLLHYYVTTFDVVFTLGFCNPIRFPWSGFSGVLSTRTDNL